MNLKKAIACGMLLGLLTVAGVAQRGRLANGGSVPAARLPNAVSGGQHVGTPIKPAQIGIAPNAHTTVASPAATTTPTPKKTGANTTRVPDRVITPDAHDMGNPTAVPN